MNDNMQALLLRRGDGDIEAFFAHAENRMIQIRSGTVTG
jgi:hypothetical protein